MRPAGATVELAGKRLGRAPPVDGHAGSGLRAAGVRRDRVLCCLVVACYWAAIYLYVPILPVYARSLGASMTGVGLVVGAYGFSQVLIRVPLGIASDRWGRRHPFVWAGVFAAGLGALGLAFAPSAEWLVFWRAVAGVAAATYVAAIALFAGYFPAAETPRAVGLLSFVTGVAQLAATTVGGRIADGFGWQAPFLAAGAVALPGLLLARAIDEPRLERAPPPLSRLARIAVVPSLLVASLAAALVQFTAWATTYAFVPIYADGLGASRTALGLLTAASLGPYTLATLAVAPLMARWGPRSVSAVGLALLAASAAVVPGLTSVGWVAVAQAVSGLGRGLASTVLMAESIRAVAPAERGTAMGVFNAAIAVGMFLGPATAGLTTDALGLTGAFLASGAAALLGALLAAGFVGRSVRA
jgi:MFS family permease